MKTDLEPVKNVLLSFLAGIEAVKEMHQSISDPLIPPFTIADRMPDFSKGEFIPGPCKEKDLAYTWLYAEAWHFRALMHRPKPHKIPEYYEQLALPIYQQWNSLEKEVFCRGCIIPPPAGSSLADYLKQLASIVEEGNEKRAVWIKSLRSFLQFIREDTHQDQQGTLEVTFPKKLRFEDGYSFKKTEKGIEKVERRYILRSVDEEIYPIDIFAASDILQNLADTILNGRPNSQHMAAEALAFAWICHAVGSSRLMTLTTEESILNSLLSSLKAIELKGGEKYFQPECYITIPTFYGPIDVPISKVLYDFLIALPRDQHSKKIFSKPLSSLLRTFYDKGVFPSDRARKLGKITFRTFTSQPHEAIGHRSYTKKTTN